MTFIFLIEILSIDILNFTQFLQCVAVSYAGRVRKVAPPSSPEISSNTFTVYIPLNSDEEIEAPTLDGPSEFRCPHVGRFAHPSSCEKYYFCWDALHDRAEFTCPFDDAFNPKTQQCEMDFSVCDMAPKCEHDGQLLPNREDNSTYFECRFTKHFSDEDEDDSAKNYRLHKEHCADGGEFDDDLGYCS